MTTVPWLTAVTFLPLAGAIVIGFAPGQCFTIVASPRISTPTRPGSRWWNA